MFQKIVSTFKQHESDLAEVIMQQAQTARREKIIFISVVVEQEKIFSWYSSMYHIRTKDIFLPIKHDQK